MVSDGIECWPVITPASARLSPSWPLALQDDQKYHILHFAPDLIVKLCNPSGIKAETVSSVLTCRCEVRVQTCGLSTVSHLKYLPAVSSVRREDLDWTGAAAAVTSLTCVTKH